MIRKTRSAVKPCAIESDLGQTRELIKHRTKDNNIKPAASKKSNIKSKLNNNEVIKINELQVNSLQNFVELSPSVRLLRLELEKAQNTTGRKLDINEACTLKHRTRNGITRIQSRKEIKESIKTQLHDNEVINHKEISASSSPYSVVQLSPSVRLRRLKLDKLQSPIKSKFDVSEVTLKHETRNATTKIQSSKEVKESNKKTDLYNNKITIEHNGLQASFVSKALLSSYVRLERYKKKVTKCVEGLNSKHLIPDNCCKNKSLADVSVHSPVKHITGKVHSKMKEKVMTLEKCGSKLLPASTKFKVLYVKLTKLDMDLYTHEPVKIVRTNNPENMSTQEDEHFKEECKIIKATNRDKNMDSYGEFEHDVPQIHVLRRRNTQNYEESEVESLSELSTAVSTGPGNKQIPVYKKIIESPKKIIHQNIYEFDSDSEKIPKSKKKKKISDVTFNKTLEERKRKKILKIKNNNNKRQNKDRNNTNYKNKVDAIVKKVVEKISPNVNICRKEKLNIEQGNEGGESTIIKCSNDLKNSEQEINIGGLSTNEELSIHTEVVPLIDETVSKHQKKVLNPQNVVVPKINVAVSKMNTEGPQKSKVVPKKNTDPSYIFSSTRVEDSVIENVPSSSNIDSHGSSVNLSSIKESHNGKNGNKKDFMNYIFSIFEDEDEDVSLNKSSSRIRILEDIVLNSKRSIVKSPWRFQSNVISRNPHFLELKRNALPALNQEAILDHTFDVSSCVEKVVCKSTKKNPKQSSILSYVESDNITLPTSVNSNILGTTLYDVDELSPVKRSSTKNKENDISYRASPMRKIQIVKRNILGELENNRTHSSTPLMDVVASKERNVAGKLSLFGFDSDDSRLGELEENLTTKNAGPFRFDVKSLRKYRNSNAKRVELTPVANEEDATVNGVDEEEKVDEHPSGSSDGTIIGIFEEMEEPEARDKCTKPEKRQKRCHFSISDDDCERPKRKRKNAKTLAEEKEVDKWVKAFRTMCDDVEKEELWIE